MDKQSEATVLTALGYWAMLHDAGIEKLYRVNQTASWMARNRDGLIFAVRDPDDLAPEQRLDVASDIISLNGS